MEPYVLNAAQIFLLDLFGPDPKPPRDYKAPHAYRGTPPRPKGGKVKGLRKRLFKGHRI